MAIRYIGSSFMDRRSYTIGRNGQIQIDDSTVSRLHAVITFDDGLMKIRDMGSTNGTYVKKYGKFIQCQEMYVSPNTKINIGKGIFSVKDLLASAGVHAVSKTDNTAFTINLANPIKKIKASA